MMNKEKMMNKVEHTNSKIQYQLDKLEFHVNKIGIDNVDDDHRLRLIDILKIDEVLTESELTIISPDVPSEETTKSFESEFDWEKNNDEVHIGQHGRDCKKCSKYFEDYMSEFEDYMSESDKEPDSSEDLEADQIVEDRVKKEPTNESPFELKFQSSVTDPISRHKETKRLSKELEELSDILHPEQEYEEQEFPTSLRGLKTFFGISERDEGKLIVAIYNKDNEAKIQIKTETRNNKILDPRTGKYRKCQRFARTRPRKFSSYSAMKRAYKPRSLNALKTRLKNLIFLAMPELNGTGVYDAWSWCDLINEYSKNVEALVEYSEHGELVDRICDLIKGGNYEQVSRSKRKVKVKPNFISNQMKSNQMKFEELVADQSRVFRSYFEEHTSKTSTLYK